MGAVAVAQEYKHPYDDPYALLAHAIIGLYRPAEVIRVLTDDTYLSALVLKETRLTDFGGPFLDCIVEDILAKKKRMEYMHRLDELARYYYKNLDKIRLRKELLAALADAGIEVPEDYSTGGKVSSAVT